MPKTMDLSRMKREPIAMRWGHDGGGMACGPVDGSTITEIMFRDDNGRLLFVSATRFEDFANVYVSEVPLFDLLVYVTAPGVDFEYELGRVQKASKVFKSAEIPELDNIDRSVYKNEIYLTLIANDYYFCTTNSGTEEDWLLSFEKNRRVAQWSSEYYQWEEEEEFDE